jgi:hypothetical protein
MASSIVVRDEEVLAGGNGSGASHGLKRERGNESGESCD